jgi:Cep192 domain 4/Abnormal spindle-like microcephaly-assoc'd, ASPM-SPD-2-Hydin/HYDIN/CFA65/VesB-like, Ig-like domain
MTKTLLVCLSVVSSFVLLLLFAIPTQASMQLSSTSISFGSVDVSSSSAALTVTITNEGRRYITVEKITSSLSQFVVSGITLPLTLSPHSSTSFSVVFRPSAAQNYSGSIVVSYNRNLSAESISVSGTGVPDPTELLSLSAGSLAFGSTLVGSSSAQSVTLTNSGTGSVTVSGVAISGAGFGVSGFSGAVTLASAQSLSLPVSFTPAQVGAVTGSLTVTSSATNSPNKVTLSGTGVQPQITITPGSVSFGTVNSGVTSTQTVTISNAGTASLSVTKATESGSGFTYSGLTLPLSIAAGASSSFAVSFDPSAAGTFSGSLTLANNSPTPSVALALSGTGVAQTLQLSSSATSLSFGNVLVGSNTAKSVTLTNSGTGSVTLSSDGVTGTGFSVTGLTLPLTLSPGQSASLTVAFAPAAKGSDTGSIAVASNAANSPTTISLSGAGVQPQVAVTPASVSFGSVTSGVTNTQTVTISNPGTASLSVTQVSESGADFTYSGLTLPLSIAAGGSSTFTVSFDPTAAGTFSGTLTLANNSPTPSVSVALSGSGVAPVLQLGVSPASLSFGSVATGTSSSNTVTLTNTGNANVSLSSDSVTGTGFSVSGLGLPLTLTPGQSTSFSVSFAPTATGSVSGSVSIVSNASNSPLAIPLSGSGTSTAHSVTLSWTPSSSTFGGFNVYRSTVSGGPYTKLDASLITTESYTDTNVTAGQSYYYVATEVDASGNESAYSAQVSATIP